MPKNHPGESRRLGHGGIFCGIDKPTIDNIRDTHTSVAHTSGILHNDMCIIIGR